MQKSDFISQSEYVSSFIQENKLTNGFLSPYVLGFVLPKFLSKYSHAIDLIPNYFSVGCSGVREWLDDDFSDFNPEIITQLSTLPRELKLETLTILCILAQSYRWNKSPPDIMEYTRRELTFPPGIFKPWDYLSQYFCIPRTNIYYSVIASNWTLCDKSPGDSYSASDISPEQLRLLYTWLRQPYSDQLEHFILSFVEMELFGEVIIKSIATSIKAIENNNTHLLKVNLQEINRAIKGINASFARRIRTRNINVKEWKEVIQISFGWGLFKNGQRMEGVSGMQVGSIAMLNAFLEIPSFSFIGKATKNSRLYLLPEQRKFLEILDSHVHTKKFISRCDDNDVLEIYNECIASLSQWRVSHQKRGRLYLSHAQQGKPKMTTGLTLSDSRSGRHIADMFHDDMQERINETNETQLING